MSVSIVNFIPILLRALYYTPQKDCTIYTISYVVKTLRVYNFAKSKEKCRKLYINLVWVCGNKNKNF